MNELKLDDMELAVVESLIDGELADKKSNRLLSDELLIDVLQCISDRIDSLKEENGL